MALLSLRAILSEHRPIREAAKVDPLTQTDFPKGQEREYGEDAQFTSPAKKTPQTGEGGATV
jgi:hypothetical protein